MSWQGPKSIKWQGYMLATWYNQETGEVKHVSTYNQNTIVGPAKIYDWNPDFYELVLSVFKNESVKESKKNTCQCSTRDFMNGHTQDCPERGKTMPWWCKPSGWSY